MSEVLKVKYELGTESWTAIRRLFLLNRENEPPIVMDVHEIPVTPTAFNQLEVEISPGRMKDAERLISGLAAITLVREDDTQPAE